MEYHSMVDGGCRCTMRHEGWNEKKMEIEFILLTKKNVNKLDVAMSSINLNSAMLYYRLNFHMCADDKWLKSEKYIGKAEKNERIGNWAL